MSGRGAWLQIDRALEESHAIGELSRVDGRDPERARLLGRHTRSGFFRTRLRFALGLRFGLGLRSRFGLGFRFGLRLLRPRLGSHPLNLSHSPQFFEGRLTAISSKSRR